MHPSAALPRLSPLCTVLSTIPPEHAGARGAVQHTHDKDARVLSRFIPVYV